VIQAIDASQGGLRDEFVVVDPEQRRRAAPKPTVGPEPAEGRTADAAESIQWGESAPSSDTPLLSLEEKRQILARIVRTNSLGCFDESGAFDIALAKRVLPPGAVRHINVDETTRIDAEGQPVTQRRIRLRLVDPLSALRLDDIFERRQNPTPAFANTKMGERKTFNLLREKTMALDDALQSIEDLKKALAEASHRERQLSNELEEKDRPLGTPPLGTPAERRETTAQQLTSVNPAGESTDSQAPSLPNPDHASQRDPSLLPVEPDDHTKPFQSESPSAIEQDIASLKGKSVRLSFQAQRALETAQGQALRDLKKLQAFCFQQEAEEVRNSSGVLAFAEWLRARGINPADYRPPAFPKKPHVNKPQKSANPQPARPSARPPPEYDP
jgi:hypothetical protein